MKNLTPFFIVTLSIIPLTLCTDVPEWYNNMDPLVIFVEHAAVILIGSRIIAKVLHHYNSQTKFLFFNVFLLSYTLSLIVLQYMWMNYLNSYSNFDPSRYYRYAIEIINVGHTSRGLSYFGVVYIYSYVMKVLGVNPVVPLFINVLVVLYAVTLFARTVGTYKTTKYYVFLLLIPEVISYNTMSSREIFCMAFTTICIIKYYEFSVDSAIRFIKRKRPQIIPNQGFIQQLKEYEKKFEKKFKKK